MITQIKMLDRVIPLWEILVIVLALAAILLVLVLWWAFGYNLSVIVQKPLSIEPAALGSVFFS
ncbi:MAG: hypothetical protein KKD39_04430 [Candidatus Altiarchaeota archaeon]|nr:hypothetical protein [Candidatus Altiarchaeota archaeon]